MKFKLSEADNKDEKYTVYWLDRDYKESTKVFKDDPMGPPENGLTKAKKFLERLAEKDRKSDYGLYRDMGIR